MATAGLYSPLTSVGAGTLPPSALTTQADQTVLGNVAGSAASPIAITAAGP